MVYPAVTHTLRRVGDKFGLFAGAAFLKASGVCCGFAAESTPDNRVSSGFSRVSICRCSGSAGFIPGFIGVPVVLSFVAHAGFERCEIFRNGHMVADQPR